MTEELGVASQKKRKRVFSSLQHPNQLLDSPSLLNNEYQGLFL
jgi:hypothetical protein